jgi:hypothetical protein
MTESGKHAVTCVNEQARTLSHIMEPECDFTRGIGALWMVHALSVQLYARDMHVYGFDGWRALEPLLVVDRNAGFIRGTITATADCLDQALYKGGPP